MTLEQNVEELDQNDNSMTSKNQAYDRLDVPPQKDEPIYSRNSPSTLNVLTNSSDFEFENR